jgi:superoxide dismutase
MTQKQHALAPYMSFKTLIEHHRRHHEEYKTQQARIAELEKALAPLVSPFAYGEPSKWNDDAEIDCCVTITYGDVARARHAMEKKL